MFSKMDPPVMSAVLSGLLGILGVIVGVLLNPIVTSITRPTTISMNMIEGPSNYHSSSTVLSYPRDVTVSVYAIGSVEFERSDGTARKASLRFYENRKQLETG